MYWTLTTCLTLCTLVCVCVSVSLPVGVCVHIWSMFTEPCLQATVRQLG